MLKLEYITGKSACIWLVQAQMSMGSDSSNDIVIDDENVAPYHAKLQVDGHLVEISNLDEHTGTYVNDRLIDQDYQLRSGDIIQLAETKLQVVDPLDAEQETEPNWSNPEIDTLFDEENTMIRPPQSQWILKVDNGPLMGQIMIVNESLKIGRDHQCDLVIPGAHISRKHAILSVEDEHLYVTDLESANGCFINNKQITGKQPLQNLDVLRLDVIQFKVLHKVEDFSGGDLTDGDTFADEVDLVANDVERSIPEVSAAFAGPWLISLSDTSEKIDLSLDRMTVGRWDNCHARINDDSVSSRHAEIVRSGNQWSIGDLASSNGTFVNGKKVTSAILSVGDKIRFGVTEYLFSENASLNQFDASRHSNASDTRIQLLNRQPMWLKICIIILTISLVAFVAKDWLFDQFGDNKKVINYADVNQIRGINNEC
jgi:pSer/pThr/pTyr-binding forkhead associated (FHA) protein